MAYLFRNKHNKIKGRLKLYWITLSIIGWIILLEIVLQATGPFYILVGLLLGVILLSVIQWLVIRNNKFWKRWWLLVGSMGVLIGLFLLGFLFGLVFISSIIGAVVGSTLLGAVGMILTIAAFVSIPYVLFGDFLWSLIKSIADRLDKSKILLLEGLVVIGTATAGSILIGIIISILFGGDVNVALITSGILYAGITSLFLDELNRPIEWRAVGVLVNQTEQIIIKPSEK